MTPPVDPTDSSEGMPVDGSAPAAVAPSGQAQSAVVPTADTAVAPTRPGRHRPRRVIAWILVVLASLLVPLSVVTVWAVNTVTNTDHYVETMAPIARQKVVTNYLSLVATDQLFEHLDVQGKIAKALPKRADFIAAPVTKQLHSYVYGQVSKIFASEWFAKLWDRTNRQTHKRLVNFLEGKPAPGVSQAQNIAVTLTPVLNRAIDQLDAHGVTVFDPLKKRLDSGKPFTFTLVNSKQVKQVRTAFRWANDVGWLLPLITVAVIAAAVGVAVERRRTLLRTAVGSAIAVAVFLALLALARTFFLHHAGMVPSAVTGTVWDDVTRFLHNGLHLVFYVSVVVALALWVAGPGRWAVTVRTSVWRALCWVGRQARGLFGQGKEQWVSGGALATARWITRFRSGIRIVGVAVVALIILIGGSLSVDTVLITALVLVIYLALVELVALWAQRVVGAADRAASPVEPPPPAEVGAGSGQHPEAPPE